MTLYDKRRDKSYKNRHEKRMKETTLRKISSERGPVSREISDLCEISDLLFLSVILLL